MGERRARRRIGIGAVVVLGGAAAIGAVLWTVGGLVPYLLALALAAVGVLVMLTALPTTPWRGLGTALPVLVLVLALAVAVPWRLAVRELHGDPLWSLDVQGFVRTVHSDGTRLLYSDDVGLHAVDLASGEELWVHDPSGGARRGASMSRPTGTCWCSTRAGGARSSPSGSPRAARCSGPSRWWASSG